jgi:hypothetical protein
MPRHLVDERITVQVSLGCHYDGAALPEPDLNHRETMEAGVRKRAAFAPPMRKRKLVRRLAKFVRKWLDKNMRPLAADSDTSVETWIEKTNYPRWRKDALLATWRELGGWHNLTKDDFLCKSFPKDETYPNVPVDEWKHTRGINSRTDRFKVAVGPIFKLIEEQVFKDPHFIKHVPIADRPAYIRSRLFRAGAKYHVTDYTAFESLFTREIMEAVEFQLYEYMVRHLPVGIEFMKLVRLVIGGVQHCSYKQFRASIPCCRMSGEMCTSLGNGFSNLMFMLFMCELKGCTDVAGVIEGDDGLFVMNGDPPGPSDFADLGLVIKMETHTELSTASFCGLIFDSEELCNTTDPIEVLVGYGWTNRSYARSRNTKLLMLLRCKALSLAHQYPGCPIIQELAKFGLRTTSKLARKTERWIERGGPRHMSLWDREQLLLACRDSARLTFPAPGPRTRSLVEMEYGISVGDQFAIEAYLSGLSTVRPLSHPCIDFYVRPAWVKYWRLYTVETDLESHNRLPLPSGLMEGFVQEWVAKPVR